MFIDMINPETLFEQEYGNNLQNVWNGLLSFLQRLMFIYFLKLIYT